MCTNPLSSRQIRSQEVPSRVKPVVADGCQCGVLNCAQQSHGCNSVILQWPWSVSLNGACLGALRNKNEEEKISTSNFLKRHFVILKDFMNGHVHALLEDHSLATSRRASAHVTNLMVDLLMRKDITEVKLHRPVT